MAYIPRATPELIENYLVGERLALERVALCNGIGRTDEAAQWRLVADHCRTLALCKTVDDDHTPDQAKIQRRTNIHPPADLRKPMKEAPRPSLFKASSLELGWLDEWEAVALELALGYLTERERVCFLSSVAGMIPSEEIAEALGITPDQVRVHLHRARQKLIKKARPLVKLLEPQRDDD